MLRTELTSKYRTALENLSDAHDDKNRRLINETPHHVVVTESRFKISPMLLSLISAWRREVKATAIKVIG